MCSYRFIISAPPLDFTKKDLYNNPEIFSRQGAYIKAIPDSFFLSNSFRHNLTLFYCTEIHEEEYSIIMEGSKLRYLGPSFFSAAHLLLRAKKHIENPLSKTGKLTPGLTVQRSSFRDIIAEVNDLKTIFIALGQSRNYEEQEAQLRKKNFDTFVFGYVSNTYKAEEQFLTVSFGQLNIDEVIILTNYYIIDNEVTKR